jgi:hypothetical protein
MQTELIQNTKVLSDFENNFKSFFNDCERGFTNELIINLYCRIYAEGKKIIEAK